MDTRKLVNLLFTLTLLSGLITTPTRAASAQRHTSAQTATETRHGQLIQPGQTPAGLTATEWDAILGTLPTALLETDAWAQTTQLTAGDGATNDTFGFAVAMSADTVVVGVPMADISSPSQGAVYVYARSGELWTNPTFVAKLTASDGASGDYLGWSVAISGDTIVAGAALDDNSNTDQGAAYVYVKPDGGWVTATQTAKLTASDGAASDQFGRAVAISGDTIVVGASLHDTGGNSNQGAAYVYVKPGAGWITATQTAKLTASDGGGADNLGSSVAISGDTIVAGAKGANFSPYIDQGAVYVYVKPSGEWTNMTQTAKLRSSTATSGNGGGLGDSVAISNDTIVAGAPEPGGRYAYVYTRPGGSWVNATETARLSAPNGVTEDFGDAVGISNNIIVVGAPAGNAAYVYARPAGGWATTSAFDTKLTASDGAAGDEFGISVAISGEATVVGAYYDDIGSNSNQGSAYLFSARPNLTLAKTVSPASAPPGSLITYTLTFSNSGLGTARNVVITDTIPFSVTNTSISSSGVSVTPRSDTRYVWDGANIAPGGGGVITITGVLSAALPVGPFTNSAVIATTGDYHLSNNTASAALTVQNVAPVLAAIDPKSGDELVELTFTASAADVNGDALTFSLAAGSVGHITADGLFTWTPDEMAGPGVHTATVRVSDGALTDTETINISVAEVNVAPIAGPMDFETLEDTPLVVPAPGMLANSTDADWPPNTLELASCISFEGEVSCAVDGSFIYTPTTDSQGLTYITFTVCDAVDCSTNEITMTIIPVNDAPLAQDDEGYTTAEGTPLLVTDPAGGVLSNDYDIEDMPLTALVVTQPAHGFVGLNADGSFAYIPHSGFMGEDVFIYAASDGELTSTARVTLTVTSIVGNQAPHALPDIGVMREDELLIVPAPGVLENDSDPNGDALTATVLTAPLRGSVQLAANGAYTYTPPLDFYGIVTFTYSLSDPGGLSDTAVVYILVEPVDDPPVTMLDAYSVGRDSVLHIAAPGVLSNDSDVDNSTLAVTLDSGPNYGQLALVSDGSFIYTPTVNYDGADSFTYLATDGELATAGNVTLDVMATQNMTFTVDSSGYYSFAPLCGGINFSNRGTVSAVDVTLRYGYPTANLNGLPRRYDITVVGENYTADLDLCYTEGDLSAAGVITETDLHAYHYTGAYIWTEYSLVDPDNNIVTAANLNTINGTWGMGITDNAPTALTLKGLRVLAPFPMVGLAGSLSLCLTAVMILRRRRR